MKRISIYVLFLFCFLAGAKAQLINGDLNHDGSVNMSDANKLVNIYVTEDAYEYLDGADNSSLVGTWYNSADEDVTIHFYEDGTTDFLNGGYTYKYLPAFRTILLYAPEAEFPSHVIFALVHTDNTLTMADNGTYYRGTHSVYDMGIEVSPTELNIGVNESYQLSATVIPENTTNKTVRWSSSNTNIATVTNDGIVRGVSRGKAIITAHSLNDYTSTCFVYVGGYTEDFAAEELDDIYLNLNEAFASPQCTYLYMACLASDDQLGGGGTSDYYMQALDLMLNPSADITNPFFNDRYLGITRANAFIDKLRRKASGSSAAKQALGEALVLRAYYYYELASMYGNVPLVLKADMTGATQGDVKTLWGQILQDYRDAIACMDGAQHQDRSIDKYAAEGLLARAWLFYTGMYGNGEDISALTSTTYSPLRSVTLPDGTTMTKSDVVRYIDDAVNNSGYSLVPDYRNLWAYTNACTKVDYPYAADASWVEDYGGINPESMFAMKFNKNASYSPSSTVGYANLLALHFGVRVGQSYENTFPFGHGWGAGTVAANLVADWTRAEPNDKRFAATIHNWDDSPNHVYIYDHMQSTRYHGKKWSPISSKENGHIHCNFEYQMYPGDWNCGDDNLQTGNIHDLILLRYADVLLMQSELKEDVTGINAVRARAGLPAITTYSLKALQDERRWELACEGVRWNDMRRWHIAADALEKQIGAEAFICGNLNVNSQQGPGYKARYEATAGFAKMPESQVKMGRVKQNPGWNASDSFYGGWGSTLEYGETMTEEQFANCLVVRQYGGTPDACNYVATADGNWIEFSTNPKKIVTVYNVMQDGSKKWLFGNTASGHGSASEGLFYFQPLYTSSKLQALCFETTESDGSSVSVTKYIMVQTAPAPKTKNGLLCSDRDKKVWKWDFDQLGTCWGNAGADGNVNGAGIASSKWWGVEDASALAKYSHNAVSGDFKSGEADNEAYMVFAENGTVVCYDRHGNPIRSGIFEIQNWDPSYTNFSWKMGTLKTSEGATLFPYQCNGGGKFVTNYDILSLTDERMLLVYTEGSWGSWSEATYWAFKKE